jgi:chromosomal replication initiator protein
MSVIEALAQARRERLERIAARAVSQSGETMRTPPGARVGSYAATVERRYVCDAAYERAWAAELMGRADHLAEPASPPRLVEVLHATAAHYDIPINEILSARRDLRITLARHVGMYLARELTLKSFPEIGRAFGGRDHTTVLHGVRRIERKLPFDGELAADIAHLRLAVEGLQGNRRGF